MNELERTEAQALRDLTVAAGGRAGMAGGAMCLSHPLPLRLVNRALPVGGTIDVPAIAGWYEGRPHQIASPAGYVGLDAMLEAAGYVPDGEVAKHQRSTEGEVASTTDLRIEETNDRAAFARVVTEAYGVAGLDVLTAFVGGPGWHSFIAWDGGEPAAAGALYVDGEDAWMGVGGTRPELRGRGAQTALIAVRVRRARELGAKRVTTETAVDDGSRRNVARAGFQQAYVRPHWRSPA